MDGRVEQPLPSTLRGLSVARVFVDVWDEPRVEDRFTVTPGIKPAIEIEIRAVDFQTGQSGHAFKGVQSLWQKYGVGFVDGCDRKRREHEAIVVHDRYDLLIRDVRGRNSRLLVAGFSSVRIRLKRPEMADCSDITRTDPEYVLIADQNGKMHASIMCIERN